MFFGQSYRSSSSINTTKEEEDSMPPSSSFSYAANPQQTPSKGVYPQQQHFAASPTLPIAWNSQPQKPSFSRQPKRCEEEISVEQLPTWVLKSFPNPAETLPYIRQTILVYDRPPLTGFMILEDLVNPTMPLQVARLQRPSTLIESKRIMLPVVYQAESQDRCHIVYAYQVFPYNALTTCVWFSRNTPWADDWKIQKTFYIPSPDDSTPITFMLANLSKEEETHKSMLANKRGHLQVAKPKVASASSSSSSSNPPNQSTLRDSLALILPFGVLPLPFLSPVTILDLNQLDPIAYVFPSYLKDIIRKIHPIPKTRSTFLVETWTGELLAGRLDAAASGPLFCRLFPAGAATLHGLDFGQECFFLTVYPSHLTVDFNMRKPYYATLAFLSFLDTTIPPDAWMPLDVLETIKSDFSHLAVFFSPAVFSASMTILSSTKTEIFAMLHLPVPKEYRLDKHETLAFVSLPRWPGHPTIQGIKAFAKQLNVEKIPVLEYNTIELSIPVGNVLSTQNKRIVALEDAFLFYDDDGRWYWCMLPDQKARERVQTKIDIFRVQRVISTLQEAEDPAAQWNPHAPSTVLQNIIRRQLEVDWKNIHEKDDKREE